MGHAVEVFEGGGCGEPLDGERFKGDGVHGFELGGGVAEGAGHFEVHEGLLMTLGAADAPAGVDHVDDEFVLFDGGGVEGFEEGVAEGVVFGLLLGGEDDFAGVEAVLEGVVGGLLLAGFGFGTFRFGAVGGRGFGTAVVGLGVGGGGFGLGHGGAEVAGGDVSDGFGVFHSDTMLRGGVAIFG
ncbi:MAG: hypothetical protein JNK87_28635 [Bryobacterales bacterium]|nr:hypothetical protein [Bryobacterales bacterium]